MEKIKGPGVFIVEKNAFPNSVVEVATAVPAFIGHTEKADDQGKSLLNTPRRISSLPEFQTYFGVGPTPKFTLAKIDQSATSPAASPVAAFFDEDKNGYSLTWDSRKYLLYYSMLLFFQNGGEVCYIVSVGDYAADFAADKLQAGIDTLTAELEPTMVVIPEAVRLPAADCAAVQQAALAHCGEMGNRVAILDVHGGDQGRQGPGGDVIEKFRDGVGNKYLDFAAAYYPWLNTAIVQNNEVSYENISNKERLQTLLRAEVKRLAAEGLKPERVAALIEGVDHITQDWTEDSGAKAEEVSTSKKVLDRNLRAGFPLYGKILSEIQRRLNLLPPAAAMAGVYTTIDASQGVWKAPANASLNAVISPAVPITDEEREALNVSPQGKSINVLRAFVGEGTLVSGARTLDGNSPDRRYIHMCRTRIMLEESIKLAAKAFIFEKNDATTWVALKSMIGNFLDSVWKRGGLAGASADDAFSVQVGLGETMTAEEIVEGILRVTVKVAISRPAEFTEITFQQMQKS
ncbi:MAG: phage tail sheath family protein [Nitrospirae bacterium]|nr:phage tail sheath family protein [Candidatus Manganitrophaceae bacterium]